MGQLRFPLGSKCGVKVTLVAREVPVPADDIGALMTFKPDQITGRKSDIPHVVTSLGFHHIVLGLSVPNKHDQLDSLASKRASSFVLQNSYGFVQPTRGRGELGAGVERGIYVRSGGCANENTMPNAIPRPPRRPPPTHGRTRADVRTTRA